MVWAIVLALVIGAGLPVLAGGLEDAKKEFKEAIGIQDYSAAGRAFTTAAGDDDGKAAKWIIQNGAKKQKFELYDGAKNALLTMKSDDAIDAMCDKARKGSFEEKMLLAEVFRGMSDKKTAQALTQMVLDKKPEVVREAAISLSERGIRDGVDNLIEAMETYEKIKGRTFDEIRRALVGLVGGGADLTSAADWKNYWAVKKAERDAEPVTSGPRKDEDGVMKDGSPRTMSDNPKFFGTEVASKRILFILDGSGSMRASASNPRTPGGGALASDARINVTKAELKKCVKGLKKSAKFDIVVYNNVVKVWAGKLAPAKEAAKKSAIKFIDEWDANQVTHTDDAVERAFSSKGYKDVDTIFLLSDGAPTHTGQCNDSPQLIAEILSYVKDKNATRKIKIFTFGFLTPGLSGPDIMSQFMKDLAEQNGGKFKALP
jgi:hypothetical protein